MSQQNVCVEGYASYVGLLFRALLCLLEKVKSFWHPYSNIFLICVIYDCRKINARYHQRKMNRMYKHL